MESAAHATGAIDLNPALMLEPIDSWIDGAHVGHRLRPTLGGPSWGRRHVIE